MSTLNPRRVLVPVQPSDLPHLILEVVAEMVGPEATLYILSVISPFEAVKRTNFNWGTIDAESREDYYLRDLRLRLEGHNYAEGPLAVAFGHPATEIVKYARKLDADLIVLPSHHGGVRLLNRTVSERVIHDAPCPVLVIPLEPEQPAKEPEFEPSPMDEAPGHRGSW
jgi:nucleotide-binding universal stress UspA family protein